MNSKPLKKIMQVEDEPDIRTIARMALESIGGFEVRSCSSGAEALEAAPVFRPDLILLDVMMPEMDGHATLLALRELPDCAETPVVYLTAKVHQEEVERLLARGAVAVIAKPFDAMELAAQVRKIWDGLAS